jgi:hypothetical protein
MIYKIMETLEDIAPKIKPEGIEEFVEETNDNAKRIIKNPDKPMLGVYIPVDVRDRFRAKCREEKVTQGDVISAFIEAWDSGEYVLERDTRTYELRQQLIKYAKEKNYKVSEVIDALVNYVISGRLILNDDEA